MIDHFYKFPDQDAMLDALRPLGMTYTDEEDVEHMSQGSHQFAAWEVGEIIGLDGWHLNVRIIDLEFDVSELEQYCVNPEHPVCVWA